MKFKFSIKSLLLATAGIAILIPINQYLDEEIAKFSDPDIYKLLGTAEQNTYDPAIYLNPEFTINSQNTTSLLNRFCFQRCVFVSGKGVASGEDHSIKHIFLEADITVGLFGTQVRENPTPSITFWN